MIERMRAGCKTGKAKGPRNQ